MIPSLETELDVFIATHDSSEIRAYKDGLKTGLNLFESLIQKGLRHMPKELWHFLMEKRIKRLSFGDLMIGVQTESGMSTNPALYINQDDYLCKGTMHQSYLQGMVDSFYAAYVVFEGTHLQVDAKSDVWVEAERLTAKFLYRLRTYIEEAQ